MWLFSLVLVRVFFFLIALYKLCNYAVHILSFPTAIVCHNDHACAEKLQLNLKNKVFLYILL